MRMRSAISLTALALALSLGGSALAFDPPRPGAGAATMGEIDPPRPPGSVPRARAVVPATIPNAGAVMPVARPVPAPSAVALPAVPVDPTPRLGPADPPLDAPNVPAYAPSGTPATAVTPFEAFRSGAQMLRHGDKEKAIRALEYAAEQGVVAAQW